MSSPPISTTDPVETVLGKLDGVRQSGNGYMARCPSHPDRQPSLSISYGVDGRALVKCFAGCAPEDILSVLGLTMADLFPADERRNGSAAPRPVRPRRDAAPSKQRREQPGAQETRRVPYDIRDMDGTLVMIHERVEYADGSKTCLWKRPDGTYGLGGREVGTLPLYGTERLADLPDGATVVVAEGEKATEALWDAGLAAVGTVTGASSAPTVEVLRCLARFEVVLWPDNDDAGRSHMWAVAKRLLTLEAR